jgi:tight adherence protein B
VRINIRPTVALGIAAVALLGMTASATSAAAAQDNPASVSSTKITGTTVSGVLTVRGAKGTGSISATSLKATLAGREVPVTVVPVAATKRATMLVVDTSGSMGETGMETVRSAVGAFLAEVPKDVAVGLVSFAGTAGVDVAPTLNRTTVQRSVNALRSRGETTLYDAVAIAARAMGSYADRSIILLSDGGDTASAKATRASATAALKANGVRAEVIGFKTGESDNTVLAGFASAGGGTVAAAGNAAAVRAAFDAAAKALDSQLNFTVDGKGVASAKQDLVLTGVADGAPFTATAALDFGAPAPVVQQTPTSDVAPAVQAVAPKFAGPGGLSPMLMAGLVALFVGIIGLALAFVMRPPTGDRRSRVAGIEQYVAGAGVMSSTAAKASPSALSEGLVNLGERVMEGRDSTTKTMSLITRADLPLRAGEWWVLRLVALVVGISGSVILFHGGTILTILAVVLGAVVGWFLPAFVLRFLAKRRAKKFEDQLPDLLMLAASSLGTGFSLAQAVDAIAKDASEPSAKEFSRALAETRIGSEISDALERVGERMDSENMRWTALAINIQRQVGGNLAETLRTTAKTLREREELRRHVRALSAEGRLSAYILIGLPIGLFFYMLKVNYLYVSLLWSKPMGWAMSAVGLVAMGIGIFWMKKVVDVEV